MILYRLSSMPNLHYLEILLKGLITTNFYFSQMGICTCCECNNNNNLFYNYNCKESVAIFFNLIFNNMLNTIKKAEVIKILFTTVFISIIAVPLAV